MLCSMALGMLSCPGVVLQMPKYRGLVPERVSIRKASQVHQIHNAGSLDERKGHVVWDLLFAFTFA